jgi:thiol-disulfide isomerase/thioredoxin
MRKLTACLCIAAIGVSLITLSCSKGSGGGGGNNNSTLTITSSKNTVRADNFEEISFTVKDQSGADVTSSCMFKINGSTYATNKFHTKTAGSVSVYAVGNSSQSNTITVTAADPGPSPFTQKIYVEDFTGTWCGYCPRVGVSLGAYSASHPNAIVVGVHVPGNPTDPYVFIYQQQLSTAFNINSVPTAIVGRDFKWNESASTLDTKLGERAPLGLSLASTVSGSTINVTAKVKFDVTTNIGMKLILLLVEDGLVYPQVNYYAPQYGSDPIPSYVHNHVLRRTATDLFGDLIPAAQQTIGNTWQANYSFNATGYNIANCKVIGLVVFDTNGAGYTGGLNAQEVVAGQTKNFD